MSVCKFLRVGIQLSSLIRLTKTMQRLPCCQPMFDGRAFLSLAVLLSELALVCPISVVQGHHAARFIIHTGAANPQNVSASELISTVYRATSRHYRSAVKYCLNQDDVASAAPVWNESPNQYSPSRFYTKVVATLNKHLQPLKEHNERHSSLYNRMRTQAEVASLSLPNI